MCLSTCCLLYGVCFLPDRGGTQRFQQCFLFPMVHYSTEGKGIRIRDNTTRLTIFTSISYRYAIRRVNIFVFSSDSAMEVRVFFFAMEAIQQWRCERFSNGGAFIFRAIQQWRCVALNRGQTDGLYFLILRGVQQSEKTGGDGSLIEGKPTSRRRRRR